MCMSSKTIRRPRSGNRAGSEAQFPGKLHDMMEYVEREGLESIISWVRNGRAIMVHNPEKLVEMLPLFFSQTKYRSFQRQLNMWHFERVLDGPDKGAFQHPYFLKGQKSLCAHMSRHVFNITPLQQDTNGLKIDSVSTSSSCSSDSYNGKISMQKSRLDLLSATLSSMNSVNSPVDEYGDCDLKDGDVTMFAGRHFHFVDCMTSDRNAPCRNSDAIVSTNTTTFYELTKLGDYNLDSVFRDLQDRKRRLLENSGGFYEKKETLDSRNQLAEEARFFRLMV